MINSKKIAIITGASSGLGEELVLSINDFFPQINEYWLIARNVDAMESLARKVSNKSCQIIALDLTDKKSIEILQKKIEDEKPNIAMLINNAGNGILCNVGEGKLDNQLSMIDVNIYFSTALTHICIPYIHQGGRIINISSSTAFCTTPRMTVYSASKQYIIAFTQGINEELKSKGIVATVICSGLMKTKFLDTKNIKGESKSFNSLPYCDTKKVARGGLNASSKGKSFYTPTMFYKSYRVLAKLLPHTFLIKFLTQ